MLVFSFGISSGEYLFLAFSMERMAAKMETTVRVDKQGRTVLPKDVREALGIEVGTKMVCRVVGNKVILEKFSTEVIQKAFAELEEIVPSLELDRVRVEGEDKYVDRGYALRKIGLRGIGQRRHHSSRTL